MEGLNEIRLCRQAGYQIEMIVFSPENISQDQLVHTLELFDTSLLCTMNVAAFEKIAYRKNVANAVALVHAKKSQLADLKVDSQSIVLVAEGIEKPGNLGALLRTADAMKATAVLLTGKGVDLFNPNAIRGSVGCAFTVTTIQCSNSEAQDFLSKNSFRVFTTFMEDAQAAWDADMKSPVAIVVGTESTGLSSEWRNPAFANINVPMLGKVDSLNVSVAVSLLLYEARRQNSK